MNKKLLTYLLFLATTNVAFSNSTVNGRVIDAVTGEPLIGAHVVLKDAHDVGAATDLEGNFSLAISAKLPQTLVVEYLGYSQQEVSVKDYSKPIDIKLSEDTELLSEVVVVGYGTQSRTKLTGSVTTVKADIIENSKQPTLDVALSGQVAGLSVTASSGQPGAESRIRSHREQPEPSGHHQPQ